MSKRKASIKQQRKMLRECERFNAEHPIGASIKVWPGVIGTGGRCVDVSIVEPGAYVLGAHTAVVQVTGGFGCIALTHVVEGV